MAKAFFWVDWIVEFEVTCRQQKTKQVACLRRMNPYIHPKFQKDAIWVIWQCLFTYSSPHPHLQKIIQSLYRLFSINYRPCVPKKRKQLLYFAITCYFERKGGDNDLLLVLKCHKPLIECAVENINVIYSQIKKNEVSPRTEYLFNNIQESKTEFEKSLIKMNIMNSEDKKQIVPFNFV